MTKFKLKNKKKIILKILSIKQIQWFRKTEVKRWITNIPLKLFIFFSNFEKEDSVVTIIVLLLQPCGVVILIRLRQAFKRKLEPHSHFLSDFMV